MNEMNFRTKLLTHPHVLDQDMLAYLEENPDKKQAVQQVREFDQTVSEVLDVEIPEGLHARILLNQSYQQQEEESVNQSSLTADVVSIKKASSETKTGIAKTGFASWSLGVAASFLVVAVTLGLWQNTQHSVVMSGEAMVSHIIEHIEEDPSLMTAVKLPSSEQEMQNLFSSVGAQLSKPVEGMSYAGMCVVEGQEGLHIVMQDKGEPVTIIVMPGHQIEAMEAFNASGYQGELIPVKGGVVAIVANTMEQVALAQIRFFQAVKFA